MPACHCPFEKSPSPPRECPNCRSDWTEMPAGSDHKEEFEVLTKAIAVVSSCRRVRTFSGRFPQCSLLRCVDPVCSWSLILDGRRSLLMGPGALWRPFTSNATPRSSVQTKSGELRVWLEHPSAEAGLGLRGRIDPYAWRGDFRISVCD